MSIRYSQLGMVRDLLRAQEKIRIAGLVLLATVAASIEAIGIGLVFPIIKIVEDPSYIQAQPQLAEVYRWLGFLDSRSFIIATAVALLVTIVGKNALLAIIIFLRARMTETMRVNMSHRLLRAYLMSPYTFHLQNNSVTLIRNVYSSLRIVFGNVIRGYVDLATEALAVSAILVMLFFIQPVVTLSVLAFFGLVFVANYHFFRRKLAALGERTQVAEEKILLTLNQSLGAVKETQLLHREAFFLNNYLRVGREAAQIQWLMELFGGTPRLVIESISAAALLGIIIGAVWDRQTGGNLLGMLGLFAIASFRVMPSIGRILQSTSNIKIGEAACVVIWRDLNDLAPRAALKSAKPSDSIPFERTIELRNVNFSYPEAGRTALHVINMKLRKGASHALVGPSGAGKSTIADILLGLLKPDTGSLMIDGSDVRDRIDSWQMCVGYVPQTIYLTDDTLRRNIAFALEEGEIDDERVREVVKLAQLESLVAALPAGLETVVGERGARLSGGQRQRIGIARALYNDPKFLILDEATSAIDLSTENEITSAIHSLVGPMTVLIIAHRMATVRECDTVFMLHDGYIRDEGNFEVLSRRHPELQSWVETAGRDKDSHVALEVTQ